MDGLKKITAEIKDKAELENMEREEFGGHLLETEEEAKARKQAEQEQ